MLQSILIAAMIWLLAANVRIVSPASIRVQDGDSIIIGKRRCRISGFDAPEWSQPYGSCATRELRSRLSRRFLAIYLGRDYYNRHLVRIFTPRGPLAFLMLAGGHAHGSSLAGWLITLWPRILRRGLWAQRHVVHPRFWRAG